MPTRAKGVPNETQKICRSDNERCNGNFHGGGVLSAYAAEEAHSGSTTVTATVGSSYSIIVPQAITLENEAGGNGSGTYTNTFNVTVKGDIGENQMVKVTATPPTMTCAGAADVATTFENGYKTAWSRVEATGAGTAAAYTVKAADLTPGSWTGIATFNCALEERAATMITFSINENVYEAEEGMTWEEWVASSYNTDGYYWRNTSTDLAENAFCDGSPFPDGKTILVSNGSTEHSGSVVVYLGSGSGRDFVMSNYVIIENSDHWEGYWTKGYYPD